MAKSADAFRTISEAATELDVPQHVLRHWEDVFGQVRPMRRAGGRRYYRPLDLDLLRGIRVLLYEQKYTTKGVQKIFKDEGAKFVTELGRRAGEGEPIDMRPVLADEDDDILDLGPAHREKPKANDPATTAAPNTEIRAALTRIVARLETVQDALDDAALALEAIEADGDHLDRQASDATAEDASAAE